MLRVFYWDESIHLLMVQWRLIRRICWFWSFRRFGNHSIRAHHTMTTISSVLNLDALHQCLSWMLLMLRIDYDSHLIVGLHRLTNNRSRLIRSELIPRQHFVNRETGCREQKCTIRLRFVIYIPYSGCAWVFFYLLSACILFTKQQILSYVLCICLLLYSPFSSRDAAVLKTIQPFKVAFIVWIGRNMLVYK